jgi:hypothetical protein
MTIPTVKVLASLLQLHGPGTTVQSDHTGINALLNQSPDRVDEESRNVIIDESGAIDVPAAIPAYFARAYGVPYGGVFRRGYVAPYGGFRRAFARAY